MKTLTLKGQPMTERILERREQYFSGIDHMTDEQIERTSDRWHAIANRYQTWIAKATLRRLAVENN